MIILAGATGSGKTEMASQIASRVIDTGHHILFFSLEMDADEMTQRILGIKAGVKHSDIRRCDVTEEEALRVEHCAENMKDRHERLHVIDRADLNADTMGAIIRRYKKTHGVSIVFVDHLGLVKAPQHAKANNAYEKKSYCSRQMKIYASDLGVCMFVVDQLNRPKDNIQRQPQLSDIRDSGCVEQDANQVILLHRERDTNGFYSNDKVHFLVRKNRHNETGKVTFRFDSATGALTDLIEEGFDQFRPITAYAAGIGEFDV